MDRRSMIATSLAAIGATGLGIMPTRAANKMSLGSWQIDIVSDGNLVLPMGFSYPDAPEQALHALLTENNLPTDSLSPDCNLTLVRDGERTILFDAGSGPFFMESAGSLSDSLEAIGVGAEEVTHVVFTHAHPDHLWGVLDDFDEQVFPNATHMISKTEFDFWIDPGAVDLMPEARKSFAAGARSRLETLGDMFERFDTETEILPGIYALDSTGHTPGHCSFELRSGGETALVVGDAITHHLISFAHGEWPSGSDQDAEMGIKTRMMLLDRLASEKMQIIGYHMPYPGTGYVERKDNAFRFVTV